MRDTTRRRHRATITGLVLLTILIVLFGFMVSMASATILVPATWGDVQTEINGASNGDVLDLSGLTSPGGSLTAPPWYTFSVPANLELTIKGNPVDTFKYIAFNFGGNNTITIQDLHIESAQGVATNAAATTFIHNAATLNFGPDTKGNTLIVEGDNSIVNRQASNITAQSYNVGAAIGVPWGTGTSPAAAAASELTITGTGSLYAQGGGAAAGIGSGTNQYSGFITITGAVSVTAVGGVHSGAALPPPAAGAGGGSGAGIGSGGAANFNGNPRCCPITIDTTGMVNAYSGRDALVFLGDPYLASYQYLNEPLMAGRPAAASIGNGSSRQGGGIPGVPNFLQIGVMSYTMPADQTVDAGGTAVFTIDVVYTNQSFIAEPTYQWQVSEDGGATWRDTTADDGTATLTTPTVTPPRTGTATFTVNPAKGIQDGNRYRVIIKAPINMHPDGGTFNWSYVTITTHPALLTVDRIGTQTTLSSNINPSVYGQTVSFTATVTADAPTAGTPVGTVEFRQGTTVLGTSTLNASGVATFSTSTLSVGSHSIVAYYLGDPAGNDNFVPSDSAPYTQVVDKADTATTLYSDINASLVEQDVTFYATVAAVAPGSGMPTGTVEFREGTTVLGTGTVDATGVAQFSISSFTAGIHPVIAYYLGDTTFNPSHSDPPYEQVVVKKDTTTALTSDVNPSVFGQTVTFTATVLVVAPAPGTPTGTVEFRQGTTVLGTGTLNASGVATFSTSALSVGTHPVVAYYLGSTICIESNSTVYDQVVDKDWASVVLSVDISPSWFGQTITFTATVSAVVPGSGTPTGTVVFREGTTVLGTGTLDGSGVATFTTNSLSVGSHFIVADYLGDDNFGEDSDAISVIVEAGGTTTTLSSSLNPSVVGQTVTFTATVSVLAPSVGTPTGTVEFREGTTVLGTGSLNASGVATFSTAALPAGTHPIVAYYLGDTNFDASNSSTDPAFEQVVRQAFTVSFNSNGGSTVTSQNVLAGQRAIRPADPTRAGYTFGGWYTNATLTTPFDFNTPVTGNVTLYAKWIANDTGPGTGDPATILRWVVLFAVTFFGMVGITVRRQRDAYQPKHSKK